MSTKKTDSVTKEKEVRPIVSLYFESHQDFIKETTSLWEEYAQALDALEELNEPEEDGGVVASEAQSGIAYALLKGIEALHDFYQIIWGIGSDEYEQISTGNSYNFTPLKTTE